MSITRRGLFGLILMPLVSFDPRRVLNYRYLHTFEIGDFYAKYGHLNGGRKMLFFDKLKWAPISKEWLLVADRDSF